MKAARTKRMTRTIEPEARIVATHFSPRVHAGEIQAQTRPASGPTTGAMKGRR